MKAEDVPLTKGNYPAYPGMEKVKEPGQLKGVDFLRWVSLILNDPSFTKQTDGHAEVQAFARFERLGLKAGPTFDPDKLTPVVKAAVEDGIEDGRKAVIARQCEATGVDMKGWSLGTDLGYKDSDWLERARYGYIAVLGPIPSRSHTGAFATKDSKGRPLSGEHRYTITFDLNDMPPVTDSGNSRSTTAKAISTTTRSIATRSTATCSSAASCTPRTASSSSTFRMTSPRTPTSARTGCRRRRTVFSLPLRFYGPYGPLIDGSYKMPGVVRTQ